LATTTAKASERVIADPPGLEREGEARGTKTGSSGICGGTQDVFRRFTFQARDEAEHRVFPRPPYLRRARSQPTTSRLQKRTSLMEWLAKLGSSGACISGAEHRDVFRQQLDKDVRFAGYPAFSHGNRLCLSLAHDSMR